MNFSGKAAARRARGAGRGGWQRASGRRVRLRSLRPASRGAQSRQGASPVLASLRAAPAASLTAPPRRAVGTRIKRKEEDDARVRQGNRNESSGGESGRGDR